MKVYDFDPNNIPQEMLAAIGLAIAAGAHTQLAIDMAIGSCLNVDFEYRGAILTHVTVPNKLSILKSVATIRIDDLDQLDRLDQILEQIDGLLKYRNDLAHHKLCRDPETNEVSMITEESRTSYKMERLILTVPEVKKVAVAIHRSGLSLIAFLRDNGLSEPKPPSGRSHAHKTKAARKKRRKEK